MKKTMCVIISAFIMLSAVNVFAREQWTVPSVLDTYFGVLYIKGDGSLWLYNDSEDSHEKLLDDVIHLNVDTWDMNFNAIRSDGTLYVRNVNWQDQFEYVMSDVADVQSVSFQGSISFFVTRDGRLFSQGYDEAQSYVLGIGEVFDAEKPALLMDNVDSVYGDSFFGVALKNDGTLWSWGSYSQSKPEKFAEDVVSVEAVGSNGVYALKKDNTIVHGYYADDGFHRLSGFMKNVKTADADDRKIAYVDLDDKLYLGFMEYDDEGLWERSTMDVVMDGVKDVILPIDEENMTSAPVAVIKNDNSLWISTAYDYYREQIPEESDFTKVMDNVESISMREHSCAIITKDGSLFVLKFESRYENHEEFLVVGTPKRIAQLSEFTPSSWAVNEVERAISLNLVPETMQKDYKANISRVDFCEILTKTIEAKTGKDIETFLAEKNLIQSKTFLDTKSKYVDYMSRLGIVNGVSETLFNPYAKIAREEAAVMLMRTAKALGYDTSCEPSTEEGVSTWATTGVGFVVKNGIMSGTGNGFDARGKYTKEQAIATFIRLYENLK